MVLLACQAPWLQAGVWPERGECRVLAPSANLSNFGAVMVSGDFDGDGIADLAVGAPLATVGGAESAGKVLIYLGIEGGGLQLDEVIQPLQQPQALFGSTLATGTFAPPLLCEGRGDALAIGVPGFNHDAGTPASGAVFTLCRRDDGSWQGLALLRQGLGGVPGTASGNARFGASLAWAGSTSGERFLAIGAPGETVSGHAQAGSVTVLYRLADGGLGSAGAQRWTQASIAVVGTAQPNNRFGHALAAGDFNVDGYFDLAIGVPGQDVVHDGSTVANAGAVQMLRGQVNGLGAVSVQRTAGYFGLTPASGDQFGTSLVAGHFRPVAGLLPAPADLAIGLPFRSYLDQELVGTVVIRYHDGDTLWPNPAQVDVLEPVDLGIEVLDGDRLFGLSLAAGSGFDSPSPGLDALLIGFPDKTIGSAGWAGLVATLPYDADGPRFDQVQRLHGDPFVPCGPAQTASRFGAGLAVLRDQDPQRPSRLAIGIPRRQLLTAVLPDGMVELRYSALFANGFGDPGIPLPQP